MKYTREELLKIVGIEDKNINCIFYSEVDQTLHITKEGENGK